MRDYTKQTMRVVNPNQPFNEDEFEDNFQKLDTNKDGVISFDELLNSMKERILNVQLGFGKK